MTEDSGRLARVAEYKRLRGIRRQTRTAATQMPKGNIMLKLLKTREIQKARKIIPKRPATISKQIGIMKKIPVLIIGAIIGAYMLLKRK